MKNTFKKVYVNMIPTNDMGAPICRFKESNKLEFMSSIMAYHTNQHLYFSINKRPIEGEWCLKFGEIYKDGYTLHQYSSIDDTFPDVAFRKLIATTNLSLMYKQYLMPGVPGRYFDVKHYPRPTDEFIQYFCDVDGDVSEVMVEFELIPTDHASNGFEEILLVVDDKINIEPAKTSWSREEVLAIKEEAFELGMEYGSDQADNDFNKVNYLKTVQLCK